MLPLPAVPFESAQSGLWPKFPTIIWCLMAGTSYSVPYNLIGEKVDIRVTKTTVEVFYHGSRVASHRRLQTLQRDPLIKLEHMPQTHQKYLTYNAEDFSRWAMSVGPMMEKVVQHLPDIREGPGAWLQCLCQPDKVG